MDVTPQLIEQIDFSEKFRGYDPDQVDDFLERVGATIAELNNAVRDANERAERAESAAREALASAAAAPPPGPVAAPAPSDEETAGAAARTLMLAQRTADQLLAESRSDAERMLADARAQLDHATRDAQAEADRLLGDARAEAESMIRSAAVEAEQEAAGRRSQVARQVDELEARKQGLAADIAALEGRVGAYRDGLERVHASIGTVLEDPDALRVHPPLDVDLTPGPAASVLEATASEPPAAERLVVDPLVSEAAPEAAPPDASWVDAYTAEEAADRPFPTAAHGTVDEVGAVEDPLSMDVAFEPFGSASPEAGVPAEVPADPWGPGSWSEVIGETPAAEPAPAVAWDSVAFSPPLTDATPAVDFDAFTATGSSAAVSQDRYLRDLDEAVNQSAEPVDDAMTAFFEGDDVESPKAEGRRFRRR